MHSRKSIRRDEAQILHMFESRKLLKIHIYRVSSTVRILRFLLQYALTASFLMYERTYGIKAI